VPVFRAVAHGTPNPRGLWQTAEQVYPSKNEPVAHLATLGSEEEGQVESRTSRGNTAFAGKNMLCPNCKQELNKVERQGERFEACPGCRGLWFARGELGAFVDLFIKQAGSRLHSGESPSANNRREHPRRAKRLPCPKCDVPMRTFNYAYDSNIFLSRCLRCRGVWTGPDQVVRLAIYLKTQPKRGSRADSFVARRGPPPTGDQPRPDQRRRPVLRFLPAILPEGRETVLIFPWATACLVAVNAAVLAALPSDPTRIIDSLGVSPARLLSGANLHSIGTAMFIHLNWYHLISNVLFIWLLGAVVETDLGRPKLVLLYLLCSFAGVAVHVATHANATTAMVGADAAAAGMLGAYYVLHPQLQVKTTFASYVVEAPAGVFLAAWIILRVISGLLERPAMVGDVSWFAHLGGFAAGATLAALHLRPRRRRT